MLILATAANRDYMERIAPYLHTIQANGAGFDRRVFVTVEAIRFRADGLLHADGQRSYNDWYFAQDAREAGFTQRCDTSVVCGHIHPLDEQGRDRPSVIWPTAEPPFYRFEEFDL